MRDARKPVSEKSKSVVRNQAEYDATGIAAGEWRIQQGRTYMDGGKRENAEWQIVTYPERLEDGACIAIIVTDTDELRLQGEAHARLMAASPRMYATLSKIAAWFERQAEQSQKQADTSRFVTIIEACTADASNYRAMARDARAAIKYATGAQS